MAYVDFTMTGHRIVADLAPYGRAETELQVAIALAADGERPGFWRGQAWPGLRRAEIRSEKRG